MIPHILKQIWNKRRANAWILIELVLVTFFMWSVIDPVYVIVSNKAIDPGYSVDNVMLLQIGEYSSTHNKYREEQNTDSARRVSFLRIYEMVRHYQDVDAAVVTMNASYPFSESMSANSLKHDSTKVSVLLMEFYEDGDFFNVFNIKEEGSDTPPTHRDLPAARNIYLTENVVRIVPRGNEQNREVHFGDTTRMYRCCGVVSNYIFRSGEQPTPTAFIPKKKFNVEEFPYSAQICLRIRDGVSMQLFAERLKQELAPQLSIGNLYFLNLTDFHTIRKHSEFSSGITNTLRLQTGLAIFFLICTFLGVAGTFWLRSDARKGEIGLRMSLGASRGQILKEFLAEGWLLTTVSWLVGIFFVLQRVFYTGFAEQSQMQHLGNEGLLQNQFIPHFLIVSFVVYFLMLLITLVGTWIPASRAARIEPAEALHDE